MKKYVLYTWHSDNGEGGTGVCYTKDKYHFMSGLKFYYSDNQDRVLTEFDTPDEAANYLRALHNLSVDEIEEVKEDIKYLLYCFHYDRGEYDEAAMYE